VEVYSSEKGEVLVFLTNHFGFGATTIAAIYKERWQIELFFKAIKQNLKIKTFVGTSANAVKIQVWTALIAMLILRYFKLKSRFAWSLSNLVALLRMNLFTYRDLWAWLDQPFGIPPQAERLPRQEVLSFVSFGQQNHGGSHFQKVKNPSKYEGKSMARNQRAV
jgi:IS4 transposase